MSLLKYLSKKVDASVFFESPGRDRKTGSLAAWKDCAALDVVFKRRWRLIYIKGIKGDWIAVLRVSAFGRR